MQIKYKRSEFSEEYSKLVTEERQGEDSCNKEIVIDVKKGTTIKELLQHEIEKAPIDIISCKFNNEIKRLNYEIEEDGEIELIDIGTKHGMRVYRRGLIYIVAKAFKEIYPEALFTVHYQLHHALLCEIDNMEVTEEVIGKVNKRVKEIIERDLPITKKTLTKEEAIEFYKRENTLRGRLQVDIKDRKEVTLYYCEDYYNYFYGVLPISTGYIKNYDLVKYQKGFLIRFPSSKTPTTIDEFKESPKLLETLNEYEDVHKILNIDTVYKLNKAVKENKIKEYILLDEALHEKKIAGIADDIIKSKDIKVILIARAIVFRKNNFCREIGITT